MYLYTAFSLFMDRNLTWFLAAVTISPIHTQDDIDCPGDILPYRCVLQSNSETLHLIWRVTLPGQVPVAIKYDMTSDNNSINNLTGGISTILTQYNMSVEYIESTVMLTVDNNVSKTNQTLLECIIMDLANKSLIVIVNSSGNKFLYFFDLTYLCILPF